MDEGRKEEFGKDGKESNLVYAGMREHWDEVENKVKGI